MTTEQSWRTAWRARSPLSRTNSGRPGSAIGFDVGCCLLVPYAVVRAQPRAAGAMAEGPAAGVKLVQALEASRELAGYRLLPATRADLLQRLQRHAEAAAATSPDGRPKPPVTA